ncbi:MAG: glycosyltransferase family 39 protein, partial [Defluviitaleaceae bacterium]|nr:glycosyltransferase family 39 protein [Defluviitaleaceae bacterium]
MKSLSKPHIIFFVANAAWLLIFSLFSLRTSLSASVLFTVNFLLLFGLCIFLFAKFAAKIEGESVLVQWAYVAAIILVGLVLRILARQIFRTDQVQDFARAHDAYMFLAHYGSYAPDMNFFQLYYSRFPGWFPHFLVTRTVYDIFGANVRNMIFVNYLLYATSSAVLFAVVKRVFSFRVAFCAVAFFIFNPNLVVWANITSPDPFFMLLFLCMLYFYSKGSSGSLHSLAVAAVFAASTDFFKPIGIMLLIAFFCVEIFERRFDFKRWAVFLFTFLAVFLSGHALIRAEIQRVFHTDTVSSTGMYMAFAWSTDDFGDYCIDPVFERFDYLMEVHGSDQVIVMEEMWAFAGEAFTDADVPRVLWQKARLTFGDEGVLGWVIHSADYDYSAAVHRVLGGVFWIGFTAHVFFVMILGVVGVFALVIRPWGRCPQAPAREHSPLDPG